MRGVPSATSPRVEALFAVPLAEAARVVCIEWAVTVAGSVSAMYAGEVGTRPWEAARAHSASEGEAQPGNAAGDPPDDGAAELRLCVWVWRLDPV